MGKPKLLDLFCGAGGQHSDCIFQLPNAKQEPSNIRMVKAIVFGLTIQFQVFYPVVVFNAIYMMNLFGSIKTPFKILSHYQAMLINITIFTRHWEIGAIWRKFNLNISQLCNLSTPLPVPMSFTRLVPFLGSYLASARCTAFCLGFAISEKLPAFFATVNASVPDVKMVISQSSISSPNNISNLHSLSIAQGGVNSNG